jgi:hypothetical protein
MTSDDDPAELELTPEEVAATPDEVRRMMRDARDLRTRYDARTLAAALVGRLVDEDHRAEAAGVLFVMTGVGEDRAVEIAGTMARLDRVEPWRRA